MTHYGKNGSFENEDLVGSEWQLVINGPCVNPEVRIGDLIIKLNVPVGENETITIDSRTKTIILTEENGVTDNVFGYRDVSVDIFTKIPRGVINVWWDDEAESDFSFTLALFDERTAPLWT
jgi:phage-related protein